VNQVMDWWKQVPWRQVQTNLREIDMQDIDAEQYVHMLRQFHATVAMINTSGIIASYPTAIPYHYQSPFLQGDSLKDIIEACHKVGIKVIARTDFSKVRREVYEKHPDWAYISPSGSIVDYNGDVQVCINGDYQQKYAFEIIRETITTLDVDGIFFNMSGYQVRDYSGVYYGICQCDSCKSRFSGRHNLPLPNKEDRSDPAYQAYLTFKKTTFNDYREQVYQFINSLRPDICISNIVEQNRGFIRQESNTALDRALPHWQYSASDNTKWAVGSYPDMVSSNTTVDFIDFPVRHVAVSPYQQGLRLVQSLANGGALDYYLIGRLDNHQDRSGFPVIQKLFKYHADNEEAYRDLASTAKIAILQGGDANTAEFRGWFRLLTEQHFLFDTLLVEAALKRPWDRYKAIIVPDYEPLGDALLERLDLFASEGGTVIMAGRSGFQDDAYREREQPGLPCMGISRVLEECADMRSAYLHVNDRVSLDYSPDADLVYLDGSYLYAEYRPEVKRYMKLIPPQMYGPPERCYTTAETEYPGFTIHSYGKGRGVFIPWRPGALYYRQGYANTADFILSLLEGQLELERITGSISPMVEATLFEKKDRSSKLLHLVNGSGHFGVSFFEPVVMCNVEVRIPIDGEIKSVKSLVSGEPCAFSVEPSILHLSIKQLHLFDALIIQ
jgi:hypothetical protein